MTGAKVVWAPDRSTESNGTEVLGFEAPGDAARDYAEQMFFRDPFSTLTVCVRCSDGSLRAYDVEVETVPSFRLHSVATVSVGTGGGR